MSSARDVARRYLDDLKAVLDRISLDDLDRMVSLIAQAHADGHRIFIVGNGGSAATSSHMMTDLLRGPIAHRGAPWRGLRAIALTDNMSLATAAANDADFGAVFSEALHVLAGPGDVLLALSCSGNSPNVVGAVDAARQIGMRVVGLSGFGGGRLAEMADVAIVVPSNDYGPVEDVHLILNHILTNCLYARLEQMHAGP